MWTVAGSTKTPDSKKWNMCVPGRAQVHSSYKQRPGETVADIAECLPDELRDLATLRSVSREAHLLSAL